MSTTTDRQRRRRLLYLVGLVPALLLLAVSGRIVLVLHDQSQAMAAYAAGDYGKARDHFERNGRLNPVEPWVAPFGEGGARYRDQDFDGAVVAFEAALDRVPDEHECVVRVNLALSHEALGDSVLEDDRTKATEAWLEARDVLQRCKELVEKDGSAKQDRKRDRDRDLDDGSLDELEQRSRLASLEVDVRLARKLGQDRSAARPPEDAPPDDEETREKRRRLEERNRKALEDNVKHKGEFETDPPPPSPEPSPTPQW